MAEGYRHIYVQTGHPCQKPPAPFMYVKLYVKVGEEVAAAKKHRKQQSQMLGNYGLNELKEKFGMTFNPSDFYYAIFESPKDTKPIFASDNYYWRQKDGEFVSFYSFPLE